MRCWPLLILIVLLFGCDSRAPVTSPARESILDALGREPDPSFERVTGPRTHRFPQDHGPHEGYQIEWWYFTGNLTDAQGDPFGFQLTFFRTGLVREQPGRDSRWAPRHTWMAHLAITDGAGGHFESRERFAREAVGLAGASGQPFKVWTGSWSASAVGQGVSPMRLLAGDAGEIGLDLEIDASRPFVLQGDEGYSRKGADPGNASHYIACTRMTAAGTLRIGGREVSVTGLAWMDHEWSTSALDPGLVGWDWFAIQLDDGRDLMVYGLRQEDGTPGPFSAAAIVTAEGAVTQLAREAFDLAVLGSWRSPHTDVRYPARWRLRVPGHGIDLDVKPLLADQEHRLAVVYWEGAIEASARDGSLAGRGYAELVGYAESSGR